MQLLFKFIFKTVFFKKTALKLQIQIKSLVRSSYNNLRLIRTHKDFFLKKNFFF